MFRRHHCRGCGRIFCNSCASNYIEIPDQDVAKPLEANSWHHYFPSYARDSSKLRTCLSCFQKLREQNLCLGLPNNLTILVLSYLDLWSLCIAGTVCQHWHKASVALLSTWRAVQYHVPTEQQTEIQKRLLWNNRSYLSGGTVNLAFSSSRSFQMDDTADEVHFLDR